MILETTRGNKLRCCMGVSKICVFR